MVEKESRQRMAIVERTGWSVHEPLVMKNILAAILERGGGRRTIERKRVDVLPVVSEDHVFLAKANGVFSSRNSIKLL